MACERKGGDTCFVFVLSIVAPRCGHAFKNRSPQDGTTALKGVESIRFFGERFGRSTRPAGIIVFKKKRYTKKKQTIKYKLGISPSVEYGQHPKDEDHTRDKAT